MKKILVMTIVILGLCLFSFKTLTAQNSSDEDEFRRAENSANWDLKEINEVQQQVDNWTPESKKLLYTYKSENWVLIAVSQRARDKYSYSYSLTRWRQANPGNKLDAALDKLAASAAKKLPFYINRVKEYNYLAKPAEQKMMKAELENLATLKIHKIGLDQYWYIEKNDFGIPLSRYTYGMVWARDTADDHPYCFLYYVNLIQTYKGGGRYGTTYATSVGKSLAGCPAGQ